MRLLGDKTRHRHQVWDGLTTACAIIVALGIWEALARSGAIDELFTSEPTAIFGSAPGLAAGPARDAVLRTLESVGEAFLIGTSLGIATAILMGFSPVLRKAFFPGIVFLVGIPKSVFLPVVVLFTGLNAGPSIVFGALLAFLYSSVTAIGGIDSVDPNLYRVTMAYRAPFRMVLRHVVVPGASAGLFAAGWHGLRNAFEGVLIGELFVSVSGIGNLTVILSNNFDFAPVYMLQFAIVIVLVLAGSLWNRLELITTRWKRV